MKRYKVTWIEYHEAVVDANDASEAVYNAQDIESGSTFQESDDVETEEIDSREWEEV